MSDRDGVTDGLVARTARGAAWVMSWRAATRILGVASTLVLVRLLRPADFGLVALATGFAQGIDQIAALGVEEAVIREDAPDAVLYNTGFTLNIVRSAATAALVAALAWPAAGFFGQPALAAILLVLAGAALLDGFGNIGMVEFRRNLAFDREFILFILPRLASTLLVIAAAALLRSYWALVVGIVCQRLLRVGLSYVMHPHRPRFTLRAFRRLAFYSFGSWAWGVAELLRDRCDTLLIGRLLDPAAVGIYSLGAELAQLPTTELVEPLGRAAFSGFSAARRNAGDAGGQAFLRLLGAATLLTLPAGIGLSLVADPLLRLAFGPAWAGAIPLVRVLAPAGALTAFGIISSVLLSAHARLWLMVRVTLAATVLRVVLLLALIEGVGLPGAALAAAAAILAEQMAYLAIVLRQFRLPPSALLGQIWRGLVACAAMALVLWASGLGWVTTDGSPRVLAASAVAGAAVYAAVLLGTWLASGRPEGAEADLLRLLRRAFFRQ